jgi:predicted RNA methylase
MFLRNKVESLRGSVDAVFEIGIEIAKVYEFHKKRRYAVDVDLYRVVTNSHSRRDDVLERRF